MVVHPNGNTVEYHKDIYKWKDNYLIDIRTALKYNPYCLNKNHLDGFDYYNWPFRIGISHNFRNEDDLKLLFPITKDDL